MQSYDLWGFNKSSITDQTCTIFVSDEHQVTRQFSIATTLFQGESIFLLPAEFCQASYHLQLQVKVVLPPFNLISSAHCQLHQFGIHFSTLLLINCLLCNLFICMTCVCNCIVFHDKVTFSRLQI